VKSLRIALAVPLAGYVLAAAATPAQADIATRGLILKACYDVTDARYFDFQYQCKYATGYNGVRYKGPWCYSRAKAMGQAFLSARAC
jgi:hypothetical protein